MKNDIKTYLSFTRKELNGIFILCLLILITFIYPYFYRKWIRPDAHNMEPFKAEIQAFLEAARAEDRNSGNQNPVKTGAIRYFKFDPNGLSERDWERLGLSIRQIRVIRNFENKGGKFYKKEDLRKIYSISPGLYKKLEPYIVIPDYEKMPVFRSGSDQQKPGYIPIKRAPLEINTADSASLESLRGIGPVLASRIVKYRVKTGGFHDLNQLREVYGIDSSLHKVLTDQVTVDRSRIVKVNINTAEFDDLKNRSHFNYRQINSILNYRKQHGNFKSVADLSKVMTLNEEIIRKIEPYLEF